RPRPGAMPARSTRPGPVRRRVRQRDPELRRRRAGPGRVNRAGMARGRDRAHPGGDLRVGADGARGLARLNPGPAHGARSDVGAGYGTFDSGVATTYVIDPHGTTVTSM